MSKYGSYNINTGILIGWYDDDIHSEIPEPSIAITEEEWQGYIDIGANYYDGFSFIVKDIRTLEEAQNFKKHELKEAYLVAEENSTIEKNGRSYSANKDHISYIYIETQLAIANNDSSILVFDTEENPNIVPISFVPDVLREMRLISRANYVKIKNKIRLLNLATTIEEVNNIVW